MPAITALKFSGHRQGNKKSAFVEYRSFLFESPSCPTVITESCTLYLKDDIYINRNACTDIFNRPPSR